jgi:hypothetical protein
MTLFLRAEPGAQVFKQVIDELLGGLPDQTTDLLLELHA